MTTTLTDLVDDLVTEAARAAGRRDWDAVRAHVDDALMLRPDHADAVALLALANRHKPAASVARRRQLTVMFCDVVGSTPLAERLDPELVQEVLTGYQDVCAAVIERFGGAIHQFIGDGVLAYFSYPRAHEDDPRRAVFAGLEMQRALAGYAAELRRRFGVEFEARIGVHTGLVAVGSLTVRGRTHDDAIAGSTPNTAARIQSAADPGGVWISDVTQALVEGFVVTEPVGPVELKGISRRISLHRATGRSAARSRLEIAGPNLSPFVGRVDERASLTRPWEVTFENWHAREDGASPVTTAPLLVSGEPGVGKSRLALQLRRRVVSDGGVVVECHCEPFARSPLDPFADGLRRMCGIVSSDDDREQVDKLDDHLNSLRRADLLPLLAWLLGVEDAERAPAPQLSPAQLRVAVVTAIREWLTAVAVASPMLLFIEDAHWADESTAGVVDQLLASPPGGCLMVMTIRLDGPHDWTRSTVAELRLEPLPPTDAAALAAHVAGVDQADAGVVAEIVERADGIPLYIEQLARITSDGADGRDIPMSLRDLLQTQLDDLGDALAVAQVAATVGRDFDRDTLWRVHERLVVAGEPAISGDELDDALVRLADAGMVMRRRDGQLRFRHALLGDAAYECQLLAERARRHGAVANVLVEMQVHERQPALVALHCERAGDDVAAIGYYVAAAGKAAGAGEYRESAALLATAESLLSHVDDAAPHELAIRMARGAARSASEGLAALGLEEEFDRCRELCGLLEGRPGLDAQLANVTAGLWGFYVTRGHLAAAAELTAESERIAERRGGPLPYAYAQSQRATESLFAGRWNDARERFDATVAAFESVDLDVHRWVAPSDSYAASMAMLGPISAVTGDPARGIEMAARAVDRARDLSFPRGPYSVAFARVYETWMFRMLGDIEASAASATDAVELGERHGFMDWQLLGRLHLFAAQARRGDTSYVDGAAAMTPVLDLWHAIGAGVGLPLFLVEQADLFVSGGDLDRADECLDRAVRIARHGGPDADAPVDPLYQQAQVLAEAFRVQGRSAHARGDVDGAAAALDAAVRVADEQGAVLFALKALNDSIELLGPDHRPDGTHERLAAVVRRFDSGSSFADLERAVGLATP